jgi:hypothetical protein
MGGGDRLTASQHSSVAEPPHNVDINQKVKHLLQPSDTFFAVREVNRVVLFRAMGELFQRIEPWCRNIT